MACNYEAIERFGAKGIVCFDFENIVTTCKEMIDPDSYRDDQNQNHLQSYGVASV